MWVCGFVNPGRRFYIGMFNEASVKRDVMALTSKI